MNGIALIPARGGSRRIPRKNVRAFLGEPALARVVRTIRDAGVADRVILSTDDDEIAEVGASAGAEIPGRRPDHLADDHTTTIEVVRHAIAAWLGGVDPDALLWVVYPTALLLKPEDLRSADVRLRGGTATFLVPVLRYPHPVERRLRIGDSGTLRPDDPSSIRARSQDLTPAYHDAGQYYVGRITSWITSSPLEDDRTLGQIVPSTRAVDIDEPEDWERAEALARVCGLTDSMAPHASSS